MYDIHCHLLPGMDDGADFLEESLQMVQLAASGGTLGIVCTPHCNVPGSYRNHYEDSYDRRLRELQERIARHKIPLRLFCGQEVFLAGSVLPLLRAGKLLTINRSVYLLCEFDPLEEEASALRKLQQLRAEGCVPIVAHPERYRFVAESPDAAARLRATGSFLQINKGSLKGAFGEDAARAAHRLLRRRIADFVASDAHSPYIRTPFLGEVHEMISELYSMDYADFLLRDNPLRVLRSQKIYSY